MRKHFNFHFWTVPLYIFRFLCFSLEPLTTALLVGGATSLLGGVMNSLSSNSTASKNYKAQKQANLINLWSAQQNFARQDRAFDYQKYLNNNQIQIQSADAQKAGINPLAMQGGTLSSGSFSNVSANQSAVPQSPNTALGDSLSSIGGTIVNGAINKSIADSQNQTTKDVARIQSNTAVRTEQLRQEGENQRKQQELLSQSNEGAKNRSSNEVIASNALAENKRHNQAVENLQDFVNITDRNYKEAQVRMQRAVNQLHTDISWSQDSRANTALSKQLSLMDSQQKLLEKEISQKNWERVNMIWRNLNDTVRTVTALRFQIGVEQQQQSF